MDPYKWWTSLTLANLQMSRGLSQSSEQSKQCPIHKIWKLNIYNTAPHKLHRWPRWHIKDNWHSYIFHQRALLNVKTFIVGGTFSSMFLNIRNRFDPQMLLGVVLYTKNDFFSPKILNWIFYPRTRGLKKRTTPL